MTKNPVAFLTANGTTEVVSKAINCSFTKIDVGEYQITVDSDPYGELNRENTSITFTNFGVGTITTSFGVTAGAPIDFETLVAGVNTDTSFSILVEKIS